MRQAVSLFLLLSSAFTSTRYPSDVDFVAAEINREMASSSNGALYVSPDDTIPDFEMQDSAVPAKNLRAFTAILLAILIVVAFLGNLFLVAAIGSSSKMRQVIFNRFVINVAIINLLDAVLNMFASLMYVANGEWPFGSVFCRINSAVVELCGLEMVLGIMLMAVDRAIALLDVREYNKRLTLSRTFVAVIGVWLIGFCYCVPIAIGSVPSEVFLYRYFCAITSRSPVVFGIVLIVTYFACSWLLLLSFGVILYRSHQERVGERSALPQKPTDFTAFIQESRAFHDQLELGKFTLYVYIVYFILQGPYVFLHLGVQVRNSVEALVTYDGNVYVVPEDAETLLTWLKFIYPVVYPFLAFGFCPEIWAKLIGLVCCRRVSTMSMGTSTGTDMMTAMSGHRHADCQTQDDSGVMTLVATSEGLHLRSAHHDNGGFKHEAFEFADVSAPPHKTRLAGNHDDYTSGSESEDSAWKRRRREGDNPHIVTKQQPRSSAPSMKRGKSSSVAEVQLHAGPTAWTTSMRAGVQREAPISSGSHGSRPDAFVPKKGPKSKNGSASSKYSAANDAQQGKRPKVRSVQT